MRMIEVELPDRITEELDALVKSGWFKDETEVIRLALVDFVRRNHFALTEQFQREDIAWALQHRRRRPSTQGAEQ